MNNNYEKLKKQILEKANDRAKKIINKYKEKGNGFIDGEPWAKELKEDSKKTLMELDELKQKYKNS